MTFQPTDSIIAHASDRNLATRSAFRRSLPLVSTSFINKCGNIGLSLLPILLIQRGFSDGQSSLVMSLVKAFILVGTFAGGWVSDRLGLKVQFWFLLRGWSWADWNSFCQHSVLDVCCGVARSVWAGDVSKSGEYLFAFARFAKLWTHPGWGLAFSWIVYRPNPLPFLLASGLGVMVLVFALQRRIGALFSS